jgi:ABC-2 type transport system ATP-binding protein
MNPSFPRLAGVELRKMVDTRAGFWLQLIVADGSRDELLAGAGTLVRATDADALAVALTAAELDAKHVEDGAFIVDANPEAVGRAALDGGVVLVHLAPSEGAGLEQLFFELTESPA